MQDATPLMQQYFTIKTQHPDTLLMFQVGDFYELFFDDAKTAAAALGIALTARGKNKGEPIPLCGVPVHALDYYLVKLVKAGFKVAICEQLEPPVPGKVVERGVTQVLTPGTLTDTKLLDEKSASYLFSFFPTADSWGLLFGELLTAQLYATVLPASADRTLESELIRFFPDEILIPPSSLGKSYQGFFKSRGYFTTMVNHPLGQTQEVDAWLTRNMRGSSVQKIYEQESLRNAISLFHAYVAKNQQSALEQFKSIQFYQPEDFLLLDPSTQRNLELIKSSQDGSRKNTLFAVMDRANTAMGSRLIKKWILRPLIKKDMIVARQDAVQLLLQDAGITQKLEQLLQNIGDIERVIGRIGLMRATLHDYVMLSQALGAVPTVVQILNSRKRVQLIQLIAESIADFSGLHGLLVSALNDDNAKPWTIKPGFDLELDRLRELVENANQKILDLELQEQQKTGIQSLKIRYSQAHGYAIEITKANLDAVPDYYTRHQTLVGRERFLIPALRDLQQEIFSAKGQIDQVEAAVFSRIKSEVVSHISGLRKLSFALSNLDALLSMSKLAYENGYVRPTFNNERVIAIQGGKHPVIASALGNNFIANDTLLNDQESVWIITGPNMGGKSTYLRQVALINIMAQCGSFVPAATAHVQILDRIFTRIGAGDNLSEGKSTFLVEMEETASICAQASKNSLVILDEVGRGTSTFDGLAIAQAVVEYIATQVQARCLFATHYHELTQLQNQIPGIASYYAASKKTAEGILFLHKILRGVADGSFGVEVAKLAGLPDTVIMRAEQILTVLGSVEADHSTAIKQLPQRMESDPLMDRYEQMQVENKALKKEHAALAQKVREQDEILRALGSLDYDNLSPKQAFDLLWKLKQN